MFSILHSDLVNSFEPLSEALRKEINENVELLISNKKQNSEHLNHILVLKPNRNEALQIIAKKDCILCGAPWVDAMISKISKDCYIHWHVVEGAPLLENDPVCTIKGNINNIVFYQDSLLFFLEMLSQIATSIRNYIYFIPMSKVKYRDLLLDEPHYKYARHYALLVGGAEQEDPDFSEEVFISHNEVDICGGMMSLCHNIPTSLLHFIVIEVTTLAEVEIAVQYNVGSVLFKSFLIDEIQHVFELTKEKINLEINCGLNINIVKEVKKLGIPIFVMDMSLNSQRDYCYTLDIVPCSNE